MTLRPETVYAADLPPEFRAAHVAVFASRTGTPMMWPMLRAQALQIIAQHERELRDLAGPGSDADVLVEFDRPVGYFHLFDVQEQLEAFLGCKVAWSRPAAFGRSCTRASSPRRSVPLRDWRLRVSDILAAAAR